MTFRLSTKSQTFTIQQLVQERLLQRLLFWFLQTIFSPVASLPYLYHCFTSLLDHLTLISPLPPALNRLFLNLLSSVLYFEGMQQLIWAEVIDVKGVTILLTFFPYWFSYPALPVWLKLKYILLWRTENYETWKYH